MRLYYSPFACSLAPHIVLREIGLPFELVRVASLQTKRLENGSDYRAINIKGQVPALQLDDGTLLTENLSILQYLADQSPASALLPPERTADRYAVMQWISYVGAEIHKSCWWYIFAPGVPQETIAYARSLAKHKFDYLDTMLTGKEFLVGNAFTIADAHLVWALTVAPAAGIARKDWQSVELYWRRHMERPAVQQAIAIEQTAREAAAAQQQTSTNSATA